ncbi:MAG: heavy-metal-associated domain-containing protein [Nanoarchaeota archaeon]|nr:heavy-metal-associated domain-containing protein [Nanoarchaeota archaeon]
MKQTINVKGMHCKSCEMLINEALLDAGVKSSASSKDSKVMVEYDEKKITIAKIKEIISKEGYKPE